MIWQHEWIDWSLIGHILAFVDRSQHIWATDSLFPEQQNRIIPLITFFLAKEINNVKFASNVVECHEAMSSDTGLLLWYFTIGFTDYRMMIRYLALLLILVNFNHGALEPAIQPSDIDVMSAMQTQIQQLESNSGNLPQAIEVISQ